MEVNSMPAERTKILAFGCHPPDVFEMAAGTLANHIRRGDDVTVVSLTYGADLWRPHTGSERKKGSDLPTRDAVNARAQSELEQAARVLGVSKTINLGFDARAIGPEEEGRLVEIIRQVRPNIVLCHSPQDTRNLDHGATGKVVVRACVYSAFPGFLIDSQPHAVDQIYCYWWIYISEFVRRFMRPIQGPDLLVDIRDSVEVKKEALMQFEYLGYSPEEAELVVYSDQAVGKLHGIPYAERFLSQNIPVFDYLPVHTGGQG